MSEVTSMKAYEYGIEAERERIIKLLESRVEPDGSGSVLDEARCSIADISDLIALIKGEQ